MAVKTISLPDLGEGVTEGEILKIKVKAGDSIAMDQELIEVMTDKASMEVPSSIEGLIETVEVSEGDIVSVGAPLFKVKTKGLEPETQKSSSKEKKAPPAVEDLIVKESLVSSSEDKLLAIPSTRRLAKELALDLKEVSKKIGSEKVSREELLNYIKTRMESLEPQPTDINKDFEIEKRQAVRGVQRLMFDSMALSKATIPHFTICEEAPADHLIQLRTEMKNRMEKQGLKVGYLAFFVKALIPVIQEFPIFNSVYDSSAKEILFKKQLNVGFAVDSPQGLLVPVIKNLQTKSLLEIIKEVFELSKKCREGRIQREDLQGAGITITNLGSLGGIYGTPIIQPPQMSILGVYKIRSQTIKNKQGQFEEKKFITFSITCDHRFIDGAASARFLSSLAQKIQEPSLLLL